MTTSTLPPTYQYSREGKRIRISFLRNELRYPIPGYWLREDKAAEAAWKHYKQQEKTIETRHS